MNNLATLLSPSVAYTGSLLYKYNVDSQLARFERLRESSGVLTASDSALESLHAHFRAAAARADALLDNMEISDTPPKLPTFKSTLDRFGVCYNPPGKSPFWAAVEASSRAGAVRRWDCRLQLETFEATDSGWFLVFDTITYDPRQYSDQVMFGKFWRRYQRSVQHAVVRRAMGSLSAFRRSGHSFADHVRYFAVPEAHKDGRTHLHILWFLSHLPDTCSLADPNAHSPLTPRRQVSGWPPYPYGLITMRLPVRYRGDNFSRKLGWRLPLDKDGKRPILKDSVAVARYVAKYLSKPKPESLSCRRIRTSPRLGLRTLQARLFTLSTPQLILLYRDPRQSFIQRALYGIPLPNSLLRIQVLREMILRFRKHLNPPPGLMRITFNTLSSVLGLNSRPQLQEHFSISTIKATMSRLPSFIDSVMNTLKSTDISDVSAFLIADDVFHVKHFGHAPSFSPSLGSISS